MTDAILDDQRYLTPAIERVLMKTPHDRWHHYAILLDSESASARLMLRTQLVQWLRANDLDVLAREAHARTVRPGSMLSLILRNDGPVFRVLFGNKGKAGAR